MKSTWLIVILVVGVVLYLRNKQMAEDTATRAAEDDTSNGAGGSQQLTPAGVFNGVLGAINNIIGATKTAATTGTQRN